MWFYKVCKFGCFVLINKCCYCLQSALCAIWLYLQSGSNKKYVGKNENIGSQMGQAGKCVFKPKRNSSSNSKVCLAFGILLQTKCTNCISNLGAWRTRSVTASTRRPTMQKRLRQRRQRQHQRQRLFRHRSWNLRKIRAARSASRTSPSTSSSACVAAAWGRSARTAALHTPTRTNPRWIFFRHFRSGKRQLLVDLLRSMAFFWFGEAKLIYSRMLDHCKWKSRMHCDIFL